MLVASSRRADNRDATELSVTVRAEMRVDHPENGKLMIVGE